MPLSLFCICALLIGPKNWIFSLFAVSVDDMAAERLRRKSRPRGPKGEKWLGRLGL